MQRNVAITQDCPFCGKRSVVYVDRDGLNEYQISKNVDKAFPYMNETEVELLISGICEVCQAKTFS